MRSLVLVVLVACNSSEAPPSASVAPRPAAVEPASRSEFTAVVVSRHTLVVTPSFEARLVRVNVELGDTVRAGDTLAELDTAPLLAQLLGARADDFATKGDVDAASAELGNASRDLATKRRLVRLGVISAAEAFAAEATVSAREGQLRAAIGHHAAATARRDELERLARSATIVAPCDGMITMLGPQPGELVHKETRIAQVSDPAQLQLRFAVPPDVPVKVGARIQASIRGQYRPIAATVRTYIPTLVPPDHLFVVEADLDDGDPLAVASVGRAWFVDR